MPELPEVERVRMGLSESLIGQRVSAVTLQRSDVVDGERARRALLLGDTLRDILRRGKQLAIIGASGRVLCVHLGMTGQLYTLPPGRRPIQRDHLHAQWRLQTSTGQPAGRLLFRDPRRFGGIWTFPGIAELERRRWSRLGPDALEAAPADVHARIARSRRPIKSALLDQAVIAGVGNIYADEALFRASIPPLRPCAALAPEDAQRLVAELKLVLREAIAGGGSTIRDYRDAGASPGMFQHRHRVYGRAGQPCLACGASLETASVAQRTTVWCARCQPAS